MFGVPVTNSQCLNYTTLLNGSSSTVVQNGQTVNLCTANPGLVTVWAGNTYVYWAQSSLRFGNCEFDRGNALRHRDLYARWKPADPTQGVNGAIAPNGSGVATFLLQNLGLGVYNLSAAYSGDVNYAPISVPLQTFYEIAQSVQITVSGGATITPGDSHSSDADSDASGRVR